MREYSFNLEAARRYGVDGAVLLQGLAVWISKNRANDRHFHDGRWWTYNSQEALTRLFPFWTRRQIQRIVKGLNEEGAVLLSNYSEGPQHNVTWFALSDEVLELLGAEDCISAPAEAGAAPAETTAPNGAVAETTAPNGAVYRTERCGHKSKPLKRDCTIQVDTTSIPPYSPPTGGESQDDENFTAFWAAYPRKVDKDRARRAWRKLKADPRLTGEILAGLRAWVASEQWQDERYIPHPATWLNNRRWEVRPPTGRSRGRNEEPPERPVEEWT